MTKIDLTQIAKELQALAAEDSSDTNLEDVRAILDKVEPLRLSSREHLRSARVAIDQLKQEQEQLTR